MQNFKGIKSFMKKVGKSEKSENIFQNRDTPGTSGQF